MSKQKTLAEQNREIDLELKKVELETARMELHLKKQQIEMQEFRMQTLQEAMRNLQALTPFVLNWMDDHKITIHPKSPADVS